MILSWNALGHWALPSLPLDRLREADVLLAYSNIRLWLQGCTCNTNHKILDLNGERRCLVLINATFDYLKLFKKHFLKKPLFLKTLEDIPESIFVIRKLRDFSMQLRNFILQYRNLEILPNKNIGRIR